MYINDFSYYSGYAQILFAKKLPHKTIGLRVPKPDFEDLLMISHYRGVPNWVILTKAFHDYRDYLLEGRNWPPHIDTSRLKVPLPFKAVTTKLPWVDYAFIKGANLPPSRILLNSLRYYLLVRKEAGVWPPQVVGDRDEPKIPASWAGQIMRGRNKDF